MDFFKENQTALLHFLFLSRTWTVCMEEKRGGLGLWEPACQYGACLAVCIYSRHRWGQIFYSESGGCGLWQKLTQ